jgi:hypothetical protein
MSIPVQVISDGSLPSIDCCDLTGWGAAEQEARIEALFQEARLLPFDFEKGPLARVSIVTLSPDQSRLLVTLSAWPLFNVFCLHQCTSQLFDVIKT